MRRAAKKAMVTYRETLEESEKKRVAALQERLDILQQGVQAQAMNKFKVGDKVRVTGDKANWYHELPDGYVAEVVSLTWSDDGLNPGCNLPDADGYDEVWAVAEVDLELAGPAVPTFTDKEFHALALALLNAGLSAYIEEARTEYMDMYQRVRGYLDNDAKKE